VTKKSKKDLRIGELEKEVKSLWAQLEFERKRSDWWQKKYFIAEDKRIAAEHKTVLLEKQVSELKLEITKLHAQIGWLQKQVFGDKSDNAGVLKNSTQTEELDSIASPKPRLKRGKQPGSQGFSRFSRVQIPPTVKHHKLAANQKQCQLCGKTYRLMSLFKSSEEIDIAVNLVRYIHQRCQYTKTCSCSEQPAILTAPAPPKVIPKGLFGKGLWSEILLEKFLLQRPIQRVLKKLELHGLYVSDGTIAGGLEYFSRNKFFDTLYTGVKDRNLCSSVWNADETGWKVFEVIEGKKSYKRYSNWHNCL
jgi:transposase